MNNSNNNFIVAVVLSLLVLTGFHYFYEKPRLETARQQQAAAQAKLQKSQASAAKIAVPEVSEKTRERGEIIASGNRVRIETSELRGSINLKGGRVDDLSLLNYREGTEKDSSAIVLLSPSGSAAPHSAYYAETGWLGEEGLSAPDSEAVWQADGNVLAVGKPVKLSWNNGKGLVFERSIAVDDRFMFTITDRVRNSGKETATLYPFGLVSRHGKPHTSDIYIMHEGPIGVADGKLAEHKYDDVVDEGKITSSSTGGWTGINDKYWLVALIPAQDERVALTFSHSPKASDPDPEHGVFQSDFRGSAVGLSAGAMVERSTLLFVGAKNLSALDEYEARYGIPLFDHAIDFGWFYFLTKPFLYLLDNMGGWFGNFGLAILAFTVLLKLATFPLSMKSYRSMARLKALQPEIQQLQERYKDDRAKASMEMMELYRREKVNPMSGCFPVLVQIPIFFALYKVLYVGIEMRHAPFYGWIRDLSAADPTSVFTLFGLLPNWPLIPHMGVWPLLMGISMFLQQKLSPQPADKMQARMFMILPIMFTFMLASMPAGLVIYWTWSNVLGIAQQWYIMRKMGGKPPVAAKT